MKLQIKVNPDTGVIEDAKFKTFGCGSAIASSSLATEWLKGKTVDEAMAIKNTEIVEELALPPVKVHCSVLAEDAIKAAIKNYQEKQDTADRDRASNRPGCNRRRRYNSSVTSPPTHSKGMTHVDRCCSGNPEPRRSKDAPPARAAAAVRDREGRRGGQAAHRRHAEPPARSRPGGKLYLRVRVQGGGCSGFQNKLDLDAKYDEKTDHKFEFHGIEVVVDKRSMLYLNGAVVDFHDDLNKKRVHHLEPAGQEHLRLRQFVLHVRVSGFGTAVTRTADATHDDHFDRLGLPRRFFG